MHLQYLPLPETLGKGHTLKVFSFFTLYFWWPSTPNSPASSSWVPNCRHGPPCLALVFSWQASWDIFSRFTTYHLTFRNTDRGRLVSYIFFSLTWHFIIARKGMNSHLPLSGVTAKWPATSLACQLLDFYPFLLGTWDAVLSKCKDRLTLAFWVFCPLILYNVFTSVW